MTAKTTDPPTAKATLEDAPPAVGPRLKVDAGAPLPKGKAQRVKRKTKAEKEAEQKQAAQLRGIASFATIQWGFLLSIGFSARVEFTPEERASVEESMIYCAEEYLPEGLERHLPLITLAMVSVGAGMRARQEKARARAEAEARARGELPGEGESKGKK